MNDIRVIVAGCRDFIDYESLKAGLNILIAPGVIKREVEIVSGRCSTGVHTFTTTEGIEVYGADGLGERYAKEYSFKVAPFPADWNKGKQAGYLRNKQMAEYATHCVCFWDGISKGTGLMIKLAREYKLIFTVLIFEQKK